MNKRENYPSQGTMRYINENLAKETETAIEAPYKN